MKTRRAKARTPAPGSAGGRRGRESVAARKARVEAILSRLKAQFPDARCSLDFANSLELLVATILSAQCTDERVNLVTKDLFCRYRTARDFAAAPQDELEEAIHSTGFYRNKAKSIRACCAALVEKHGGAVPDTMEALTALAGVGRKTANVVLGNAFGKEAGIVVDTHVMRLANRLRFSRHDDPGRIEEDLMKVVPRGDWTLFAHLFIRHGRRTCSARSPDCEACPIAGLCPSAGKAQGPRKAQGTRERTSR